MAEAASHTERLQLPMGEAPRAKDPCAAMGVRGKQLSPGQYAVERTTCSFLIQTLRQVFV